MGLQILLCGTCHLMSLYFNDPFCLSTCEKPKTKNGTQVGGEMERTIMVMMIMIMVKNEWKTSLFITKYWVDFENGK